MKAFKTKKLATLALVAVFALLVTPVHAADMYGKKKAATSAGATSGLKNLNPKSMSSVSKLNPKTLNAVSKMNTKTLNTISKMDPAVLSKLGRMNPDALAAATKINPGAMKALTKNPDALTALSGSRMTAKDAGKR